jgi:hypothetical protein
VIKPKPVQAPVEGGFTAGDFAVDEQAGTVTCPAGVTRTIPPARHVVSGAACRACPLRARCTTSKSGRALSLTPHDQLLRAARADWAADPGLRQDYRAHRPDVERVIAQVATFRGRRLRLRYRGVASNHAWLKRRTAALNLRNLAGKGLAPPGRRLGAGHLSRRPARAQGTPSPSRGSPGPGPAKPGPGKSQYGQLREPPARYPQGRSPGTHSQRSRETAQFSRLLAQRTHICAVPACHR